MSVRLFAAIDLPADARDRLAEAVADLRASFRRAGLEDDFRWVAVPNLHLTLRFLGSLDDETAVRVIGTMQAPVTREPLQVILGKLGAFPPRGRPRVLHVAVAHGMDGLRELRDVIDARLSQVCAWESETRPFAPHLTLARARDTAKLNPAEFSRLLEAADWPALSFSVDAVTLFSSRTLQSGPQYTAEAEAGLRSD